MHKAKQNKSRVILKSAAFEYVPYTTYILKMLKVIDIVVMGAQNARTKGK